MWRAFSPMVHPELRLHLGGGRREGVVGGGGGKDEEIDVVRRHAGISQRALRRAAGEIGAQLAFGGDMTLADPGTLHDPFIRRVDAPRQFRIG